VDIYVIVSMIWGY